jgi:hypothetical protein
VCIAPHYALLSVEQTSNTCKLSVDPRSKLLKVVHLPAVVGLSFRGLLECLLKSLPKDNDTARRIWRAFSPLPQPRQLGAMRLRSGPRFGRAGNRFSFFFWCPAGGKCPLHRLNRPADGCAADALCRRFAYFLPQATVCLPFGLPRLRRAQLRVAPPAGKKQRGKREAARLPKPPHPYGRNTPMSNRKSREPYSETPTERGPP